MAKAIVGRGGSVFGAGGGRWIVGVLAVAGTLVMACALSPGLRADLDGLGIVAASLGGTYAAVVKDVVLSFGILSLPAVGTARAHRTRASAGLERNTSGRFRPRNREARQAY